MLDRKAAEGKTVLCRLIGGAGGANDGAGEGNEGDGREDEGQERVQCVLVDTEESALTLVGLQTPRKWEDLVATNGEYEPEA